MYLMKYNVISIRAKVNMVNEVVCLDKIDELVCHQQ